jgi:hypothetical protein
MTHWRNARKALLFGAVVATVVPATSYDARAQIKYSYTAITNPNGTTADVYGINNKGQAVGTYIDQSGNSHGFIYDTVHAKYTLIDYPHATGTWTTGINDSGHVVGYYYLAKTDEVHGFLYVSGDYRKKDYPGSTYTEITGINNLDHYVGRYGGVSSDNSFMYTGSYTTLDQYYEPQAINNLDEVAGYAYPPENPAMNCTYDQCGFVLVNGQYTIITVPISGVSAGATYVQILGLDDSGHFMGVYGYPTTSPPYSLFVYDGANFATIPLPQNGSSAMPTPVGGMNNADMLAGYCIGTDGQYCLPNTSGFVTGPPTLIPLTGEDGKPTAAGIGMLLGMASDQLDAAAIVNEGPAHIAENVAAEVFVGVVVKVVAGTDEIFGQQIELSAGVTDFFKEAVKHFTKVKPASLVLEVGSMGLLVGSMMENHQSPDPPDPNYTVVATPQELKLPTTNNATVDKVIADYLNYASLSAAVLHAAERWQGATLADDQVSATLQENAYETYVPQMDAAKAVLDGDNATLETQLPKVKLNQYPGGAKAIAAAFNAQCGQPLPPNLNNLLLGLGLTQPVIDAQVCAVAQAVRPQDISTDFDKTLSQPIP